MNANKRLNYFRTGLVLVTSLFLWNLFSASFFSQNGGGIVMASGPTMLEITGKVVKTMNGGGYTYALVNKDGAKTWGWPCPRVISQWVMKSPACRA